MDPIRHASEESASDSIRGWHPIGPRRGKIWNDAGANTLFLGMWLAFSFGLGSLMAATARKADHSAPSRLPAAPDIVAYVSFAVIGPLATGLAGGIGWGPPGSVSTGVS